MLTRGSKYKVRKAAITSYTFPGGNMNVHKIDQLDKEHYQQDTARDQVQEETQRVEKERSIHIQIKW